MKAGAGFTLTPGPQQLGRGAREGKGGLGRVGRRGGQSQNMLMQAWCFFVSPSAPLSWHLPGTQQMLKQVFLNNECELVNEAASSGPPVLGVMQLVWVAPQLEGWRRVAGIGSDIEFIPDLFLPHFEPSRVA